MAVDFENLNDEEYFAQLKLMFNTDGWEILMSELRDQADIINNLQDTKDVNDLHYRKGQLATIAVMLNFEETIKRAEEDEQVESIAEDAAVL